MRHIAILCIAVALIATLCSAAIWGWIQWRYDRLVLTDVAAVPRAPVAIVFGAGISHTGQLSPMLRDRMDAAIALHHAGVVRKLLVSGDNRLANYDEPGRMYDYAIAQGLPPQDVVRDFAGRRTYDTCYRAKAIFGVDQAVLVSQRFHLARALFTCRSLGIDSVGFSADNQPYSTRYNRAREVPATISAWWDVTVARPLPVLGQKEDMGLN